MLRGGRARRTIAAMPACRAGMMRPLPFPQHGQRRRHQDQASLHKKGLHPEGILSQLVRVLTKDPEHRQARAQPRAQGFDGRPGEVDNVHHPMQAEVERILAAGSDENAVLGLTQGSTWAEARRRLQEIVDVLGDTKGGSHPKAKKARLRAELAFRRVEDEEAHAAANCPGLAEPATCGSAAAAPSVPPARARPSPERAVPQPPSSPPVAAGRWPASPRAQPQPPPPPRAPPPSPPPAATTFSATPTGEIAERVLLVGSYYQESGHSSKHLPWLRAVVGLRQHQGLIRSLADAEKVKSVGPKMVGPFIEGLINFEDAKRRGCVVQHGRFEAPAEGRWYRITSVECRLKGAGTIPDRFWVRGAYGLLPTSSSSNYVGVVEHFKHFNTATEAFKFVQGKERDLRRKGYTLATRDFDGSVDPTPDGQLFTPPAPGSFLQGPSAAAARQPAGGVCPAEGARAGKRKAPEAVHFVPEEEPAFEPFSIPSMVNGEVHPSAALLVTLLRHSRQSDYPGFTFKSCLVEAAQALCPNTPLEVQRLPPGGPAAKMSRGSKPERITGMGLLVSKGAVMKASGVRGHGRGQMWHITTGGRTAAEALEAQIVTTNHHIVDGLDHRLHSLAVTGTAEDAANTGASQAAPASWPVSAAGPRPAPAAPPPLLDGRGLASIEIDVDRRSPGGSTRAWGSNVVLKPPPAPKLLSSPVLPPGMLRLVLDDASVARPCPAGLHLLYLLESRRRDDLDWERTDELVHAEMCTKNLTPGEYYVFRSKAVFVDSRSRAWFQETAYSPASEELQCPSLATDPGKAPAASPSASAQPAGPGPPSSSPPPPPPPPEANEVSGAKHAPIEAELRRLHRVVDPSIFDVVHAMHQAGVMATAPFLDHFDVFLVVDSREKLSHKQTAACIANILQREGLQVVCFPLVMADYLWIARPKVQVTTAPSKKKGASGAHEALVLGRAIERKEVQDLLQTSKVPLPPPPSAPRALAVHTRDGFASRLLPPRTIRTTAAKPTR